MQPVQLPDDIHRQNTTEHAPDNRTDGDMFTLITTVQQIMTGLQTADIADDRFAVIMRAVYGPVMRNRNKGHSPPYPIV
jgi:hypothetical protein